MKQAIKKTEGEKSTLKVLSKTKDSVKVLLPMMDIPVEMTYKYFNYIKNTGAYLIMYCVTTI